LDADRIHKGGQSVRKPSCHPITAEGLMMSFRNLTWE
jgi:hypothetical protein